LGASGFDSRTRLPIILHCKIIPDCSDSLGSGTKKGARQLRPNGRGGVPERCRNRWRLVIYSVMYNPLLVITLLKSSSPLRLIITIFCVAVRAFKPVHFAELSIPALENLGAAASHAREGATIWLELQSFRSRTIASRARSAVTRRLGNPTLPTQRFVLS